MANNWAIAIGVNNYQNLPSLDCAVTDATKMRDWFVDEARFEKDKVYLFTDNSPPIEDANKPYGSQPTYGTLIRFLTNRFKKPFLSTGDNLWFFFSGHGLRHAERDYLMLSDSSADSELIDKTAISLSYVTEQLRRCGADNVVLFLDACRNELKAKGSGLDVEPQPGVITFASCSPAERSYEIEPLHQGSFTYALLESLRLQGEGNCATVERLYNRLRYRVSEINQQYQKPRQTPYAIVEPATKYHLILLPKEATLQDVATLKLEAQEAELEGDLALSEQLWTRILTVSPADPKALKALRRIWGRTEPRQLQPPAIPNSTSKSAATIPGVKAPNTSVDLGNGITLEMVRIPGGSFLMGSVPGEKNSSDGERPQHKVTIQSFSIGKYPITQAEWRAIANCLDLKINQDLDPNPAGFKNKPDSDRRPIEQVSWKDAIEFCGRLSKLTGQDYRLPSEAEWEYACRAGTTTAYSFGKQINETLVNYGKNVGETTPVSKYPANQFGLYDMHGNVWEWCLDPWHSNYKGAPTDGSVWDEQNKDENCYQKILGSINVLIKDNRSRVQRGGSWITAPKNCRSASRYFNASHHYFGFRVVCAP